MRSTGTRSIPSHRCWPGWPTAGCSAASPDRASTPTPHDPPTGKPAMLLTELIRPLPELIEAHAERFGDKIAYADARRSVSYAELAVRTRRLAGHLAELRLAPGDRAAICLGNRVETIESYLAITRAAGIGVPLNPASTDAELDYLLSDSGARIVITDQARAARIAALVADRPHVQLIVVGDEPPVGAGPFAVPAESVPAARAGGRPGPDGGARV